MQGKNMQEKAWRQTFLVDRKQTESFAKDVPKIFPFSITIPPWADRISKIFAENDQSQAKHAKEEKAIFHKLSEICSDIDGFREQLKSFEQTQQFLVRIQASSEGIVGKLQQFRGKMGVSYQQLADEQDKLKEELQLLNKKIECMGQQDVYDEQKENVKNSNRQVKIWEREREKRPSKALSPREEMSPAATDKLELLQQKMRDKQKEMEAIEKEIASLGRNLGWPQQDHNDFVSIWHRGHSQKNYFQIEQELQGYFAFYTGEQIQQHMNKYLKLRKLNEQKRQTIVQFKTLREERKVEELRLLHLERDLSNQEKEKAEMKKRQEKEQEEMKQKVEQWRLAKLREKKDEEDRKKEQQAQHKREQAARRRQKVDASRQRVDQWKEKEQQKQEQLRRVQSARKQPTINKQAEERIRAREDQLLMRKLDIVNERRRQQDLQKQKQVKIKEQKFVKYSHVNNKLEHKTAAMKEKEREKFDGKERKEANTFGGQLLMTGVRATPAWMKGL